MIKQKNKKVKKEMEQYLSDLHLEAGDSGLHITV